MGEGSVINSFKIKTLYFISFVVAKSPSQSFTPSFSVWP